MKRRPKRSLHIAELMAKVKGQLAELNRPVWVRGEQEPELTIEEYKRMDPYWLSTMTWVKRQGSPVRQAGQRSG